MDGRRRRRLRSLGLTRPEELAYLALVAEPGRSAAELAAEIGGDPERMGRTLVRLARLGLVRSLPYDDARFVPGAPHTVLTALASRREAELAQARMVAEQLSAVFWQGRPGAGSPALLEVVSGPDAIADRLASLTACATRELLFLDAPPHLPLCDRAAEDEPRTGRGVTRRAVYSGAALERPGVVETVLRRAAGGESARMLPELPTALVLADRRTALLPLSGRPEGPADSALLVHPSALLGALALLFETVWTQATPLAAARPGPARAVDDILPLLAMGLKDEAIARHLGVSPRTARRRITDVLGRLGARTRFQAGLQAGRRGWL